MLNSLLMTVLVEWMMLSICALTPGCSPKPLEGSLAQPTEKIEMTWFQIFLSRVEPRTGGVDSTNDDVTPK